ncbi:hypothetical protein [Fluviicola sp.]|uniref:hypothetical protein n=1 Tax=Fluviicola sp. TaxID=1917219 RepID=UPI00260A3663|nr:hypothetical protein [Fluviicola sp.]
MGFKEQQAAIQRELDRFIDLLGVMLPRYSKLLKSKNLSEDELHELGEMEHFLIGVNGRIGEIKNILEQDVFGHGLHQYYKTKKKAQNGDQVAIQKLEHLRKSFEDALVTGAMIQWN